MSTRHHLGTGGGEELTYEGYLRIQELVRLQQCRSEPVHHDELLFIITHQAYELWFKLILFEVDAALESMQVGDAAAATHGLRRVVRVEQLLVQQIHIMETMRPVDFLGFREQLNPAKRGKHHEVIERNNSTVVLIILWGRVGHRGHLNGAYTTCMSAFHGSVRAYHELTEQGS